MANLLFARPDGQWFDFPPLEMAGMEGNTLIRPVKGDLIPLPEGATLTMMPDAAPVGFDRESGEFLELAENPYKKKSEPVYAMAALLPQGFTRLLLPACEPGATKLPILGYTAVGIDKGRLVVAAQQTDEHRRWHPKFFNTADLPALIEKRQREFPGNRIIRQLTKCALEYGCFTAQNIFYRRWEGGIPASPACNANCRACLSAQPDGSSPQQRIDFCPIAEEIAAVAVAHLREAEEPMISFGQGCEGEPSLAATVIADALRLIRRETDRGAVNINTNAGQTAAIARLIDAGMDSLRVSLFSAVAEDYEDYHRPQGYGLADVCASLAVARESATPVALNLLVYPGFSDTPRQTQALIELVRQYRIRLIQMRNLNCDPRLMLPFLDREMPIGMKTWLSQLELALPEVKIGSYSHLFAADGPQD